MNESSLDLSPACHDPAKTSRNPAKSSRKSSKPEFKSLDSPTPNIAGRSESKTGQAESKSGGERRRSSKGLGSRNGSEKSNSCKSASLLISSSSSTSDIGHGIQYKAEEKDKETISFATSSSHSSEVTAAINFEATTFELDDEEFRGDRGDSQQQLRGPMNREHLDYLKEKIKEKKQRNRQVRNDLVNEIERVESVEIAERIASLPPILVPETMSDDGMFYPGNSSVNCSEEDLEEMVKLYGGNLINRELPPSSPSPAKSVESMALEIVKLNGEIEKLRFYIEEMEALSEDRSTYVLRRLESYARSDDVSHMLQEQLKTVVQKTNDPGSSSKHVTPNQIRWEMSHVFYYIGVYLVGGFIDANYDINNFKYILPMTVFVLFPKSMPLYKYSGTFLPFWFGLVLQFLMYFLVCMKLKSFPEVIKTCQYAVSTVEELYNVDFISDPAANVVIQVIRVVGKNVFRLIRVYLNFNVFCLDRLWTICDLQGEASMVGTSSSFFFSKQEVQVDRFDHLLQDSCALVSDLMSSNEWTRFFVTDINSDLWF